MKIETFILFCVVFACSGRDIKDNSEINETAQRTTRFLDWVTVNLFFTNVSQRFDFPFQQKESFVGIFHGQR